MRRIRDFIGIFARVSNARRKRRGLGKLGFTVLELFIVCEIIGFLATIVLANYHRSKKAAQVAVTLQNIRNVQVALTSYYAMENEFPPTLNTIWLQFYNGRVVDNFEYIGGTTAANQGGWDFFASNSDEIRFSGPGVQGYALRSTTALLPYALYIYGDVATAATIVH
jgi:type II secretory pathway pseudopilin PulG